MYIIPRSIKSILFIDALLYLFGIIGIYLISIKADLPLQTEYNESTITIKKLIADSNLKAKPLGDLVKDMILIERNYERLMKINYGPSYFFTPDISKKSDQGLIMILGPYVNEINAREKLYKKLEKK